MTSLSIGWKRKAAVAAGVLGISLLGWGAYAQVADDDTPIQGTIEVTEGADYAALAKITLDEAKAAALAEVPNSTITESELEEEDGYLVYEIELDQEGTEIDVLIDAGNAAVLETERDDDNDND